MFKLTVQSKPCIVLPMLPEQIEKMNIGFLTKSSKEEIITWLLHGESLSPINYRDDRSDATLFQHTVQKMVPKEQEKVAGAIVEAIEAWNPENYSNELLRNFAYMAAYTKNTSVIPALSALVNNHKIVSSDLDDDTEATIVSVIAGFAPDQKAKEMLGQWWEDPFFEWEGKGVVFIGLLTCDHELIHDTLPSLLSLLDKHPNYFRLDILVCETARVVGISKLENALAANQNPMARKLEAFIPVAKSFLAEIQEE